MARSSAYPLYGYRTFLLTVPVLRPKTVTVYVDAIRRVHMRLGSYPSQAALRDYDQTLEKRPSLRNQFRSAWRHLVQYTPPGAPQTRSKRSRHSKPRIDDSSAIRGIKID